MRITTVLFASAMLALAVPVAPAFAHQEGVGSAEHHAGGKVTEARGAREEAPAVAREAGGSRPYDQHARDAEHQRVHGLVNEADGALGQGSYSSDERRGYQRALRDLHNLHEDHPGTRHEHDELRR